MGRPRKDSNAPDAQSRMIEAFWRALEEKPYTRITVSDISRLAQVNKNTLYYHYDRMEDLVIDAIRSTLPFELAVQLLEGKSPAEIIVQLDPTRRTRMVKRIALAAGPQGCGILSEMLRATLVGFWLEKHQLEPEDLLPEEALLCRFSSSGMVSVFGGSDNVDPQSIALFFTSPFASSAVREALTVLGRAQERKCATRPLEAQACQGRA